MRWQSLSQRTFLAQILKSFLKGSARDWALGSSVSNAYYCRQWNPMQSYSTLSPLMSVAFDWYNFDITLHREELWDMISSLNTTYPKCWIDQFMVLNHLNAYKDPVTSPKGRKYSYLCIFWYSVPLQKCQYTEEAPPINSLDLFVILFHSPF